MPKETVGTALVKFCDAGNSSVPVTSNKMAKNRNIDFYSARGKDKADFLPELSKRYNVESNEMIYVGDDLFDLSIMKLVGLAFCPNDAPKIVRDFCGNNVINKPGGHNVIAEMVDRLIEDGVLNDCTMKDIENLDKNERF